MKIIINPNSALFAFVILIASIISSPLIVISFLLLILLPGLVLVKLFLKNTFTLPEEIILSCGIGIAFIALATYILKILTLPLNIFTVFIILFSLCLFYVIKYAKISKFKLNISVKKQFNHITTALLIILLLAILTRVYPVTDLNAPLFADPAVEGTISRLIIDNQGIPKTWEPFLPVKLSHQPGFASIIAWFNIVSGVSIAKIILFLTNIIHALFPLSIYFLAYQLLKNKFQSITASLLSLIASFPTYIFIAGMNSGVTVYFLIPLAVALSIFYLNNNKAVFLIFLMSAGAFLIHPIFIFFYILLSGSYSLLLLFENFNLKTLKKIIVLFFISVIIPLLLVLPYFSDKLLNADGSSLAKEQWKIQAEYINPLQKLTPTFFIEPIFTLFNNPAGVWYIYPEQLQFLEILFSYPIAIILLGFFIYSIYVIFRSKNKTGYLVFSWFLLFMFFSSFQSCLGIKFSGWEFIYPSRVKFLMALPISLLISFAFLQCKQKFNFKKIPSIFLVLVLIVPFSLIIITNHLYSLSANSPVSDYDIAAMEWIEKNIEKDEIILNTLADIEAGAFIGGAGQWIPALTGRIVVFPATSLTENLNNTNIRRRVKIMEFIENETVDNKEFLELLKEYNVSYVYISKNYMRSRNMFSFAQERLFLESPFYKLEYSNQDVHIFRIKDI